MDNFEQKDADRQRQQKELVQPARPQHILEDIAWQRPAGAALNSWIRVTTLIARRLWLRSSLPGTLSRLRPCEAGICAPMLRLSLDNRGTRQSSGGYGDSLRDLPSTIWFAPTLDPHRHQNTESTTSGG
jgi:hypothetical protein